MIRRHLKLTGGTKRVTCGKLPHSSKELGKSTEEECHTDNGIRNENVARMHVEKGEY
jgi:hypothetical protein